MFRNSDGLTFMVTYKCVLLGHQYSMLVHFRTIVFLDLA
ncbi:unnamed protein product [Tenebrio molitor]|nr:unnamed protein product [Tenebrio molitor]